MRRRVSQGLQGRGLAIMSASLFKDEAGVVYHGLALCYVLAGYGLGIAALFHGGTVASVVGVLLLGHSMTIAAYLLHECAHHTVFRSNAHNARLGVFCTWITGSCYGTYEDIRYKHFRHHADNADIMWFDSRAWLATHPLLTRLVLGLEWLYIPAHDVLMHGLLTIGAFAIPARRAQRPRNLAILLVRATVFASVLWLCRAFAIPARRAQRPRNLAILLVRATVFASVLWLCPRVAIRYVFAYLLMITVLRFMDALQHDYDGTTILFEKTVPPHRGDRAYEQVHTFSNPLSMRYRWLNVLVLNFGFHNAHHARAATPWYKLPALHDELFGTSPERVIPLGAQLRSFHRYRVSRVMGDTSMVVGPEFLRLARLGVASGGNAVSFLTPF